MKAIAKTARAEHIGSLLRPRGLMDTIQKLGAHKPGMTNLQNSPLCSLVVLGTITTQEGAEGQAPILVFTMNFHYLRKET